jgi:hypothetical protein
MSGSVEGLRLKTVQAGNGKTPVETLTGLYQYQAEDSNLRPKQKPNVDTDLEQATPSQKS